MVLLHIVLLAAVHLAELEHPQVALLAVEVAQHALQHVGQHVRPQAVEMHVGGVVDAHQPFGQSGEDARVAARLVEGQVHGLGEAAVGQHGRHAFAQSCRIGLGCGAHRNGHAPGLGHLVVAMDPQDLLDHVHLAGDVALVAGHLHGECSVGGFGEGHAEGAQDAMQFIAGKVDTRQRIHAIGADLHAGGVYRLGVVVGDAGDHLPAGHLGDQQGCPFEGVDGHLGVGALLEDAGGLGAQSVAGAAAADMAGVEVGGFQEDGGGLLADAGMLAAEHAGHAEGLAVAVADHEVLGVEMAFHPVERDEGCALGQGLHADASPANPVEVEGVQGLSQLVQHVVGDIHHVVDGTLPDGGQGTAQPLGRRAYVDPVDGKPGVAGAGPRILDGDGNGLLRTGAEGRHVGRQELALVAVAHPQGGVQVARHAQVVGGIGAVGSEADLEHQVLLQAELPGCRGAGNGVGGQHQDAGVVAAEAELVLGADHAFGVGPTDAAFLDGEGGAVLAQHLGAGGGHQHLLAFRDVGGAADDGQRVALTDGHGAEAEAVGFGVTFAGEHLAHDDAFEAVVSCAEMLFALHFEAKAGEQFPGGLRGRRRVEIPMEPVEGDLHREGVRGYRAAKVGVGRVRS